MSNEDSKINKAKVKAKKSRDLKHARDIGSAFSYVSGPKAERANPLADILKHVKVVSDAEAEQCDMVVCMPNGGPRYFDDDIDTVCAKCGTPIHHRPHVPKTPPKVCIDCALIMSNEDKSSA